MSENKTEGIGSAVPASVGAPATGVAGSAKVMVRIRLGGDQLLEALRKGLPVRGDILEVETTADDPALSRIISDYGYVGTLAYTDYETPVKGWKYPGDVYVSAILSGRTLRDAFFDIKKKKEEEAEEKRRKAEKDRELAEATKKRKEEEKQAWIEAHGSERLKEATKRGYDCKRLYLTERLALELPGYVTRIWDGRGLWDVKDRCCPSAKALDEVKRLEKLGFKPVIKWAVFEDDDGDLEEEEIVYIENYHDYEVYKTIEKPRR